MRAMDKQKDTKKKILDSAFSVIVSNGYDKHPWYMTHMPKQYLNAEIIRLKWLLMTILPEASEEKRNKLVKDTIVSTSLELDAEDIKALDSKKLLSSIR